MGEPFPDSATKMSIPTSLRAPCFVAFMHFAVGYPGIFGSGSQAKESADCPEVSGALASGFRILSRIDQQLGINGDPAPRPWPSSGNCSHVALLNPLATTCPATVTKGGSCCGFCYQDWAGGDR